MKSGIVLFQEQVPSSNLGPVKPNRVSAGVDKGPDVFPLYGEGTPYQGHFRIEQSDAIAVQPGGASGSGDQGSIVCYMTFWPLPVAQGKIIFVAELVAEAKTQVQELPTLVLIYRGAGDAGREVLVLEVVEAIAKIIGILEHPHAPGETMGNPARN